MLGRYKLSVKAIISTHAHIDPRGRAGQIAHVYGRARVMMHGDDLPLYHGMEEQAAFIGMATPELTESGPGAEGWRHACRWGGFHASVIHTPGHTPGSVSLYMPKDCGRVKLAAAATFCGRHAVLRGASGARICGAVRWKQIMEIVARKKLMQLPDDTLVHPGHGGSTTIGLEKEMNPFLK